MQWPIAQLSGRLSQFFGQCLSGMFIREDKGIILQRDVSSNKQ